MVAQQLPGMRPGIPRNFPQGPPRNMPPRITPPGFTRGIPPGVPPGMPRNFPLGSPGLPPGLPPPAMPPHPMQIASQANMQQQSMPPHFQQGILPNVPQVVQGNTQLGINMVAQPPVFLPGNMQMLGVPPTPGQLAVRPPVPQPIQVTQNAQTKTSTANHLVQTTQSSEVHNNSQNIPNGGSRHDKKETTELDEGEIIDDEDHEEKAYHRPNTYDRYNNRPYPNDRQYQRRISDNNYKERREDERRFDHHQGRGEPFNERAYDDRYEDDRRERNWNRRHHDRRYEHERFDRHQDYYRPREQYDRPREDHWREYDRCDNQDRRRDYDDDRSFAEDRLRYGGNNRQDHYDRDRRGALERSSDRRDFGMAAEQADRGGSVNDRYRDDRNSSRSYDYEDRRNFDREQRDGRRDQTDHRHRDDYGMAAEFADRTRTGRSPDPRDSDYDRGRDRKRRYPNEYESRLYDGEWDQNERNHCTWDYDRYDKRQDLGRDSSEDTRRDRDSNRHEHHRNSRDRSRRDSSRDDHSREDRKDRKGSPPRQRRKREYFDSNEGVWKEGHASNRDSTTRTERLVLLLAFRLGMCLY